MITISIIFDPINCVGKSGNDRRDKRHNDASILQASDEFWKIDVNIVDYITSVSLLICSLDRKTSDMILLIHGGCSYINNSKHLLRSSQN